MKIILIISSILLLLSCKKEVEKNLLDNLENNTLMLNGKKLLIYSTGKTTFVPNNCGGLGIVGTFYVYASNGNNDSAKIFAYNLKDFTGKKDLVEYGLSGNECKIYLLGSFKFSGSQNYTSIKSGYSGALEFSNNSCLFKTETGVETVAPKVFTTASPQISYECYWRCSY